MGLCWWAVRSAEKVCRAEMRAINAWIDLDPPLATGRFDESTSALTRTTLALRVGEAGTLQLANKSSTG